MKTTKGNAFFDRLAASIDPVEYERVKNRMNVAAKIADALKQKGMAQKELANLLGKKPSEISRMLTGTMNLTHDTMFDLQRVLGIELINVRPAKVRKTPKAKMPVFSKAEGSALTL